MTFLEKFLLDFWQDMQKVEAEDRKDYIKGHARILELRQEEAQVEGYKRGHIAADIANHNSPKG